MTSPDEANFIISSIFTRVVRLVHSACIEYGCLVPVGPFYEQIEALQAQQDRRIIEPGVLEAISEKENIGNILTGCYGGIGVARQTGMRFDVVLSGHVDLVSHCHGKILSCQLSWGSPHERTPLAYYLSRFQMHSFS